MDTARATVSRISQMRTEVPATAVVLQQLEKKDLVVNAVISGTSFRMGILYLTRVHLSISQSTNFVKYAYIFLCNPHKTPF